MPTIAEYKRPILLPNKIKNKKPASIIKKIKGIKIKFWEKEKDNKHKHKSFMYQLLVNKVEKNSKIINKYKESLNSILFTQTGTDPVFMNP